MPLHVRSISIKVAVICFFGIAVVGWAGGLSPFTCCKRAMIAAIVAYAATVLAVKAINSILISAITKSQMDRYEGKNSVGGD
ncbi:MAG: hypothetical protein DRP66_00700 [Planctomycetota bacterium]|nr:MAG: hypothetical protein DRP66_00700 [Planctomycetota bacterium]